MSLNVSGKKKLKRFWIVIKKKAMIRILELKSYLHIVENNKMFNVKDLVIEKIISCNVCDAEGKIIGETTRSLDDEPFVTIIKTMTISQR